LSSETKVGVIGGSGFYALFGDADQKEVKLVKTPFGDVIYIKGEINGKQIYFLPRHGTGHSVPPHMINYKANIYALYSLGIKYILSTNAVGSLKLNLKPGDFVVLDQFIDFTSAHTYFDGSFETKVQGELRKGVLHLDMTEPYSPYLRKKIIKIFKAYSQEKFHPVGVYIMNNGPRFETPAEIRMQQQFGGDLVGMTNTPECILARELGLEYATICLITNYAAGLQKEITHQEVIDLFEKKIVVLISIIKDVIRTL